MFKKDEVKWVVDDENGLAIMDICKQFFKRTQTDYQIVPRRELARQMRLKAFNVDIEGGPEAISPDGRFFKLYPKTNGRIKKYLQEGEQE